MGQRMNVWKVVHILLDTYTASCVSFWWLGFINVFWDRGVLQILLSIFDVMLMVCFLLINRAYIVVWFLEDWNSERCIVNDFWDVIDSWLDFIIYSAWVVIKRLYLIHYLFSNLCKRDWILCGRFSIFILNLTELVKMLNKSFPQMGFFINIKWASRLLFFSQPVLKEFLSWRKDEKISWTCRNPSQNWIEVRSLFMPI